MDSQTSQASQSPAYVPGRPARPRGPALPSPLLQPQGLSARAAAERRGRDHRPARRAARRPGAGAAVRGGRHPAGRGLRGRAHRGGRAQPAGDHRPQLQAGGSGGIQEARSEFLGQFGIGLLACFVVAERIRVVSRSARTPDAPPVEWTAADDGSYTVRTLPDEARPEPGTTVHLVARPGAGEWLTEERVLALARDFGSLLPYDVRVGDEAVTDLPAPWDRRVSVARHPKGGPAAALSRPVRVHAAGLDRPGRAARRDPRGGVRPARRR